jgi:hypothetical protein
VVGDAFDCGWLGVGRVVVGDAFGRGWLGVGRVVIGDACGWEWLSVVVGDACGWERLSVVVGDASGRGWWVTCNTKTHFVRLGWMHHPSCVSSPTFRCVGAK